MNEYLEAGYDEEKTEAGIRPGVGLSAVQLGHLKIIAIFAMTKKGIFHYGFINPKIISILSKRRISQAEKVIFRSTVKFPVLCTGRAGSRCAHVYDFKDGSLSERVLALEGFLAIVFQHEYDHLNGILFRQNRPNKPFTFPKTAARLFSNRK